MQLLKSYYTNVEIYAKTKQTLGLTPTTKYFLCNLSYVSSIMWAKFLGKTIFRSRHLNSELSL